VQPPPLVAPTAQPAVQPPAVVEPSPVVDQKTAGHSQGCVQASTSAKGKACAPPGQQKKGPPEKP